MTRRRKFALGLSTGLVVILVVGFVFKFFADRRFFEGYDPQAPLNVVPGDWVDDGTYLRQYFSFEGVEGTRVPAAIAIPKGAGGPFPCVIFLHGIGQDKTFLEAIAPIFCEAGFALITFDQHMRGERRLDNPNWFASVKHFRRRASLTVNETRRTIDYLATRDDIDPSRIYLVGGSYGAITGATAVALDKRIRAAVLTYGGGDLKKLLSGAAIREELGAFHGVAVTLAAYLLKPADPLRRVGQIAPRPLLMQNGMNDTIVAPVAAQALFDAAREPKEIVWYEGDHVGLEEGSVERVLGDAIQWLVAVDRG